MSARVDLVKSELNEIYNLLNESFEYVNIARIKSDNRFKKIFEILMEIKRRVWFIMQDSKGKFFLKNNIFYNKMDSEKVTGIRRAANGLFFPKEPPPILTLPHKSGKITAIERKLNVLTELYQNGLNTLERNITQRLDAIEDQICFLREELFGGDLV